MSGSLLTPINVNSKLAAEGAANVDTDIAAVHKAIKDGNYLLAEQISAKLMQNRGTKDTFICNITESEFGPLDMWHFMPAVTIPGKKPNEPYCTYRVIPHTDHMDLGDMRTLDVPITSYDTAVDVIDKFNGHIGRGSYAGLFVIGEGRSVPTEQELEEADKKLLSWDLALIREGDRYYDLKRTADISDLHRNACRRRRVKKSWLPENSLADVCKYCGSDIKSGIAICPVCKVILDPVKMRGAIFADGKSIPEAPVGAPLVDGPKVEEEKDLISDDEDEVVTPIVSTPLKVRG